MYYLYWSILFSPSLDQFRFLCSYSYFTASQPKSTLVPARVSLSLNVPFNYFSLVFVASHDNQWFSGSPPITLLTRPILVISPLVSLPVNGRSLGQTIRFSVVLKVSPVFVQWFLKFPGLQSRLGEQFLPHLVGNLILGIALYRRLIHVKITKST